MRQTISRAQALEDYRRAAEATALMWKTNQREKPSMMRIVLIIAVILLL